MRTSPRHWSLLLPLLFGFAAALLLLFGRTTSQALGERRELALEGAAARLAQQLERELREVEPGSSAEVLAAAMADSEGLVIGLVLSDSAGQEEARVGQVPPDSRSLSFDLGGRAGRGGVRPPLEREPGGRRGGWGRGNVGRRSLRLVFGPNAASPTPLERSVFPVAALAAAALVGLALLAGRQLDRQAREFADAAQRERLESLARAGAGLAHQLRNPLATIKGSAQLLLEHCAHEEAERLGAIVVQADRLGRLVDELLDYARPPQPQPEAVDLAAFRPERDLARVRWRAATGAVAWVDAEHLRLILDNLLDNALEADSGEIEVTAERSEAMTELAILDRGPGPGPDPERLFEPYVSGKAAGTGLGLPLARSLALANRGRLFLEPRPGGGTAARVRLPAERLG